MFKQIISSVLAILAVAFSLDVFAQETSVSGTVSDSAGPVTGAVIMSGGTGVMTDADGHYSISVKADAVLEVACLGYKPMSVQVNGRQRVDIILEEDSTVLGDAVVVGYGTQIKANLTGAVSVIKSENLKDRSALDVGQMLQGSVAGLNVTSASGRPGQGTTINIRGLNSINSSSPLVLVDGVEGNIQYINPADVESISVIKDAASAAIYGSKGSAGVILVTTKSGSAERLCGSMVRVTAVLSTIPATIAIGTIRRPA